jgi:hypothetical protein
MLPKLALEVTDLVHGSPLLGKSNHQTLLIYILSRLHRKYKTFRSALLTD